MSTRTPSNLEAAVEQYGLVIPAESLLDLRMAEQRLLSVLTQIIEQATFLRDNLTTPEGSHLTVSSIAQSAGASGTIGTLWSRAIGAAVEAQIITAHTARGVQEVK